MARSVWFGGESAVVFSQAGPEGAVVSEFSTQSTDDQDIFADPRIKRMPEIAKA
jgi:D-lyxose ketol-isomerase